MGYASKNRRRDGGWRRIVVQVARPNIDGPHQARILRGRVLTAKVSSYSYQFKPLVRSSIALRSGSLNL